jgi:hypothetical protein
VQHFTDVYGAGLNKYGAGDNKYGAGDNNYGTGDDKYGARLNKYGARLNKYGARDTKYGAADNSGKYYFMQCPFQVTGSESVAFNNVNKTYHTRTLLLARLKKIL